MLPNNVNISVSVNSLFNITGSALSFHPSTFPIKSLLHSYRFLPCLRMQKEKFHTHLAVLYLERVLSLLSQSPTDEEQLNRARDRLQALLRESNLYRAQFLLGESV